jgi:hypothetical protein
MAGESFLIRESSPFNIAIDPKKTILARVSLSFLTSRRRVVIKDVDDDVVLLIGEYNNVPAVVVLLT